MSEQEFENLKEIIPSLIGKEFSFSGSYGYHSDGILKKVKRKGEDLIFYGIRNDNHKVERVMFNSHYGSFRKDKNNLYINIMYVGSLEVKL